MKKAMRRAISVLSMVLLFTIVSATSATSISASTTVSIGTLPWPTIGGTVSVTPSGGRIDANGWTTTNVALNSTVTIQATPNAGWEFAGWYNESGNSLISTNATYSFTATQRIGFVALFTEIRQQTITIATMVWPETKGRISVTPSGGTTDSSGWLRTVVPQNSSVTLQAIPDSEWVFDGWYTEGPNGPATVRVSADATYTFTATETRAFAAKFEQPSVWISIGVTEGGTVSKMPMGITINGGFGRTESAWVALNTSITLRATPNNGWNFIGWYDWNDAGNHSLISIEATYTFIATQQRGLIARFEKAETPNISTADSWAVDGINEAYAKGFVPNDLLNNYRDIITRAEFCQMSVKWVEYKTGKTIDEILLERGLSRNPNAFNDTNDPYILAAFALGITSGTTAPTDTTPGMFTPNGEFNRQQAATMIMNTCRVIGINTDNPPVSDFVDLNDADSWARNGINFVRANGIMTGTSTTPPTFSPKDIFTRQQSILTFNNIG